MHSVSMHDLTHISLPPPAAFATVLHSVYTLRTTFDVLVLWVIGIKNLPILLRLMSAHAKLDIHISPHRERCLQNFVTHAFVSIKLELAQWPQSILGWTHVLYLCRCVLDVHVQLWTSLKTKTDLYIYKTLIKTRNARPLSRVILSIIITTPIPLEL